MVGRPEGEDPNGEFVGQRGIANVGTSAMPPQP